MELKVFFFFTFIATVHSYLWLYCSWELKKKIYSQPGLKNKKRNKWNSRKAQPLNLISTAPPLSTLIQTSSSHQFKPQQQNPHRFKMQNSTTKTQAKRNHQFDLHGSTTLTDSNKLRPPKLIQKPTTYSATHNDSATHTDSTHNADSTHLWNPATDSTSILV